MRHQLDVAENMRQQLEVADKRPVPGDFRSVAHGPVLRALHVFLPLRTVVRAAALGDQDLNLLPQQLLLFVSDETQKQNGSRDRLDRADLEVGRCFVIMFQSPPIAPSLGIFLLFLARIEGFARTFSNPDQSPIAARDGVQLKMIICRELLLKWYKFDHSSVDKRSIKKLS